MVKKLNRVQLNYSLQSHPMSVKLQEWCLVVAKPTPQTLSPPQSIIPD